MISEIGATKSRVVFSQLQDGYVVGFADETHGPIVQGHDVLAYELDGEEIIFGRARIVSFDPNSGVIRMRVSAETLQRSTRSESYENEPSPTAQQLDAELTLQEI